MAQKARAIQNVAAVLAEDGVLFGATVLGFSAEHTRTARMFLRLANFQGGFDNRDDQAETLQTMLEDVFEEVAIDLPSPSVAHFAPRALADIRQPEHRQYAVVVGFWSEDTFS